MNLVNLQKAVQELPRLADMRQFGRSTAERAVLESLMTKLGVLPNRVDDITGALGLSRGRVFAVRWDITTGETGFKQPVMSALLLFHLWRRRAVATEVQVLTDGGNFNTCLALSFLAARLGLQAEHILSRHFTQDARSYMQAHGNGCLKLIEAPPAQMGKEREFYAYLLDMMREPKRRRTHLCLWHAKYSGIATRWLGEALAESCNTMPDDIVFGLGSGSTLEGYAIPLKARFDTKPRIVIAEHQRSRLVCDAPTVANLPNSDGKQSEFFNEFRRPPSSIPHMVLGPHYDDVNPLLPADSLTQIDAVVRYSDADWQDVSHACRIAGMPIGNSSAANLAVARYLASQGRTVFTFIYEPLREFYVERQMIDRTQQQKEPFKTGLVVSC
jgi:cysteine synthase